MNQPVALAGKNIIEYPCGKQLLCKQIPVLGWHWSTALWLSAVHMINQVFCIARCVPFPALQLSYNRHLVWRFDKYCWKIVLLSDWKISMFIVSRASFLDNIRYHRSPNPSIYRIQWKWAEKIKQNRQMYAYGISPLTCTIFDPTDFSGILRYHVFHISPTRSKNCFMGNYRLRS